MRRAAPAQALTRAITSLRAKMGESAQAVDCETVRLCHCCSAASGRICLLTDLHFLFSSTVQKREVRRLTGCSLGIQSREVEGGGG